MKTTTTIQQKISQNIQTTQKNNENKVSTKIQKTPSQDYGKKDDLGTCTKLNTIEHQQLVLIHLYSTYLKRKTSPRNEPLNEKVYNYWNNIVNSVPNNITPLLHLYTLSFHNKNEYSSLLSISKDSYYHPKKKKEDKIDEYIKTWERRRTTAIIKKIDINSII